MTSSLTDRLKRLVEFDMRMGEAVHIRDFVKPGPMDTQLKGIFAGGRYENARLKPLIHQLLQCVEALDKIFERACYRQQTGVRPSYSAFLDIAEPALAALEDACAKMEGK